MPKGGKRPGAGAPKGNKNPVKEVSERKRGKAIHVYIPAKLYLALVEKYGDQADKAAKRAALEALEGLVKESENNAII